VTLDLRATGASRRTRERSRELRGIFRILHENRIREEEDEAIFTSLAFGKSFAECNLDLRGSCEQMSSLERVIESNAVASAMKSRDKVRGSFADRSASTVAANLPL